MVFFDFSRLNYLRLHFLFPFHNLVYPAAVGFEDAYRQLKLFVPHENWSLVDGFYKEAIKDEPNNPQVDIQYYYVNEKLADILQEQRTAIPTKY